MRWLLDAIARLVRHALGLPEAGAGFDAVLDGGEQDPLADERAIREASLLALGGERRIVRQRVGPPVSADGIGGQQEVIIYAHGLVPTRLEVHELRRCPCGTVLTGQVFVLGICSVCGVPVCSSPGCAARCCECGATLCRRHAVQARGRMYCTGHRLLGYWSAFWEGVP